MILPVEGATEPVYTGPAKCLIYQTLTPKGLMVNQC